MKAKPEELLRDCSKILKERGQQYGSADLVFRAIADQWTSHLHKDISSSDAALMMAQMKIARINQGISDQVVGKDTYLDAINYLALAWSLLKKS